MKFYSKIDWEFLHFPLLQSYSLLLKVAVTSNGNIYELSVDYDVCKFAYLWVNYDKTPTHPLIININNPNSIFVIRKYLAIHNLTAFCRFLKFIIVTFCLVGVELFFIIAFVFKMCDIYV